MAHILNLEVSRLAGREGTFRATLNRDINVFFGLNGTGKTSLLKILHSALSGDTSLLRRVPFEQAKVSIYSMDLKKEVTRTIKQSKEIPQEPMEHAVGSLGMYVSAQIEEQATRTSPIEWRTTPPLPRGYAGAWRHRYLPTSRLYLSQREMYARIARLEFPSEPFFSEDYLDKVFAAMIQSLWASYSAQLLSQVRTAQEDGLASILRVVLTPGRAKSRPAELDVNVAYERLHAFLKRQGSAAALGSRVRFERSYATDSKLRRIVSDIDRIENRIEVATKPREFLKSLVSDMYSGNKTVEFSDTSITVRTNDDKPIGLQDLSSGEKQLLRLFIEALMAGEGSVLVDEPEISMHVDWQRRLVQSMLLLNGSAQLIMATHSPEVMADLHDDQVFRL